MDSQREVEGVKMAASEDVREALNMLQVKDKCEGVVEKVTNMDGGGGFRKNNPN